MRALETSLFDFTQVAFWDGQESENEFKVTCEPLKHCFFDLTQVSYRASQEAENEFKVTCEHLKHRILGDVRGCQGMSRGRK